MSWTDRRRCTTVTFLLCVGLVVLALSSKAQSDKLLTTNKDITSPSVPTSVQLSPNYVIGPEDVLEIDVFNLPELSNKVVRVANDGTITLPLVGRVQAAGLTPEALRKQLELEYGKKYLENPQITVFVREFHAQPVSVIGAVAKPGLYQLIGPKSLIEVLSMAGGLAEQANVVPAGQTVLITRPGGFGNLHLVEGMHRIASDKLEIDLPRLLKMRNDALNIEIRPLDIISVSKAEIVYVIGGVRKPGGFVLKNQGGITVLQALAMAQGTMPDAAKHSARIIRTLPDGARTEVPIDLDKILKGKSKDLQLAANDILYVPNSTTKAAAKKGLETILATVSGIMIFRGP